jgi:hypothetical protein
MVPDTTLAILNFDCYYIGEERKCLFKSMNPENVHIPAAVTGIAKPVRNTTARMAHQPTAEKPARMRNKRNNPAKMVTDTLTGICPIFTINFCL